ncbi:hypothetical protein UREG_05730 [Uncinocarpus reesii 1704]|uniref:NADP-dependent oxidoreductase domain-containing protein n=1 Tax=Uncinocarpus reesii (strain UAMH 1704) TaxID=336963 RepID=C4JTE1_UNCRE|nr:uncharacterized protein UREG_05730 [Uncinocarpus reesii 1704]EEP80888.1 hypothetical protein UREG_05730 [Uncinocarpus reesii 1704]
MAAPEHPTSIRESLESTKVEYRRLGKSGLKVSVPILGAMSFGSSKWMPWVIDEDKWDTANVYSNGDSERIIAKAIKNYRIPRENLVIMTKCFGIMSERENLMTFGLEDKLSQSKEFVNQHGLSRQAIFSAVNASLKRLETDYIDLLQIHRFDYDTPIEETMEALHDLVKSGKVRYIGASSMFAYQFAMMQFCAEKNGWTKFVSMQNKYNVMYREEEREMNRFCKETGVGLIPWSPLERGFLARPPSTEANTKRADVYLKANKLTEQDLEIIGRVEEIAKKKGRKMVEVAIAWTLGKVTSPIIGFSSIERMDDALTASQVSFTEEEMKYLEEPYKPKQIVGHF